MIKRTLSFLSVILAMAFVFMAPANAIDAKYGVVSFENDTDTVPTQFDHDPVMVPDIQSDFIDNPDENYNSVYIDHAGVDFSSVKGGGFSLAHASKAACII